MSPQWRRRAKCKTAAAQVEPAGMTTAVSILRVSTKRQLNEGEGIENQRRGNDAYIARKRYRLHREFVLAESASEEKRTDFDEVLAYLVAHRKEIQVAVFWKLDRISRGGVGAYYALKAHLARYGIRIEFATENIDGSASGELMESILAATARFENRLRVDRTIGAEKIITRDGQARDTPVGTLVGCAGHQPGEWCRRVLTRTLTPPEKPGPNRLPSRARRPCANSTHANWPPCWPHGAPGMRRWGRTSAPATSTTSRTSCHSTPTTSTTCASVPTVGRQRLDPEATWADFLVALRDGDAEVASDRLDDTATWLNRGGFAPARLKIHGLSLTDMSRLLTSAAVVLAWAAYDLKEGKTR